jgi:hypothetical protein
MVAGCFLLTIRLGAAGAEPDTIYAPGIPNPIQEIPILTSTDSPGATTSYFQATVSPLMVQRVPDATGALADSADESVDFGWRLPLFSGLSIGYDYGVNSFRQDQTIWDDEEATSLVTSALFNKAGLEIQAGPPLKWTNYVQGQRSLTDGQTGFSDATKYGTEAAWTPVKDVTTLKVQASTQETYNFDRSILDENLYTTSLDQKLPYIPFTLHTAGSVTDDTAPLLAANDKNNTIVDGSLLWKIDPGTSLSGGVQRQDTSIPASMTLQNTNVYFTQVTLQPAQAWTVTMRAAHEQRAATEAGQFLSNGSDVLLSFGLTWSLGDRFNAGAGLNYRVLQSQTPASAQSTPPATFSVSAGGKF